ncbi:Protein of Unknown function [Arsukibacterium tuosuense]|uniref:DUF2784 domain-containing protein n=1 Tax=Arsukibacterium tuosuense TaxID=1323745 RepID=A0A285IP51_9GAMM|nr:DUF2784 domain-containing protein [Arsukibacterium tuosuense]SNY49734.1 Protein of Unknown function [Arsukibacterium tuosuense]
MSEPSTLLLLADAILIIHFLVVLFVVGGLLAIYLGHFLTWHWVGNKTFRLLHLLAIAIVVLQSWLGVICPLTVWEMALREKAGAATYAGSFVQHWLQYLLYYTAPDWVFIALYSGFACLVLMSWYLVPPVSHKKLSR